MEYNYIKRIDCDNWVNVNKFYRGDCKIGKTDGKPSYAYCVHTCGLCKTTVKDLEKYHADMTRQNKVKQTKFNNDLNKLTLSKRQLIKNAGKHGLDVLKYAIKNGGKILATKEERARRLGICQSNRCNKYDKVKQVCNDCGCKSGEQVLEKTKLIALNCKHW